MAILEHFHETLRERGIHLVVCGIEKGLEGLLTRSGIRAKLGEQNLFYADNTLFRSTELALARARAIVDMRRAEAARGLADAPPPERATGEQTAAGLTARDLMSRRCIRFGQGHSVREAVWLLSEMNKRSGKREPQPLFLQNTEGKLVGKLTPWALLRAMTEGLDPQRAEAMSDAELGRRLSSRFGVIISSIARTDLPDCGPDTPLWVLLREARAHQVEAIPIRDEGGRAIGVVEQGDLLRGIGEALGLGKRREKQSAGDRAEG